MAQQDDFDRGLRQRRAVLGDEWVDRAVSQASAFTADFQDFITRYAWHEVWGRPGLDRVTRRLLVLGMTMAAARWEEFELHCRAAVRAGVPLAHAERLTVLRYLPGEQYRPHRDYLPPGSPETDRPDAGNRLRTICVYLNGVEAGGATAFPHAGLEIAPKAGRAVVFDNLHADGRPDPDSLHAGLPVEAGEKWLATLWIRQRPYRAL